MEFFAISHIDQRKSADLLVLPFWQIEEKPIQAFSSSLFKESYRLPIEANDFKAKEGEASLIYLPEGVEKRLLLLGLGPEKKATVESLRKAYGSAGKFCLNKKCEVVNLLLPTSAQLSTEQIAQGVAEGLLLVNYSFDQLKSESIKKDPVRLIEKASLIGASEQAMAKVHHCQGILHGVYLARDLVNRNADDVTPQYLASYALDLAKQFPAVKTTILGKEQIEKEGMGLLVAVSQGAAKDPAFIIVEYRHGEVDGNEHTVIIGKGVTYDTGGLNLKPTGGMETMKCDMAGAAATLGTVLAACKIGLKAHFSIVIAATENAIGSHSYKPGDVFKSFLGKTVEITNTDAEGRLTMADALAYAAAKLSPTRLIDISTLTGAVMVALGEDLAGLFGSDDKLVQDLQAASESTAEHLWHMPLFEDYKEQMKSDIADLRNTAPARWGGAITAALFLKEFVGTLPWAHLDIAGPAFLSKEKRYLPKNGTGMGVRLLIEFLEKSASSNK